jgi:signal transduction histidine kinase
VSSVSKPSSESRLPRSLYARSLLFVAMGGGALLGALIVLSTLILRDAEERLLEERVGLVKVAGALLEGRIRGSLTRLSEVGRALLETGDVSAYSATLGDVANTTFTAGVVVLDRDGRPVAATGRRPDDVAASFRLAPLLAAARAHRDVVVSELERDGGTARLVALTEIPARGGKPSPGFVAGILAPDTQDLLEPLRRLSGTAPKELDLVDAKGIVVASSNRGRLFDRADHKGVLSKAIAARAELTGRCHSCHGDRKENDGGPPPEVEVHAFAPLPTLALGLSVLEPESTALGPAMTLRWRLWIMGGALIVLFVGFTMLAVRSVVRPIRRLTRAVAAAELSGDALPPMGFGPDEVGALSRAMEQWRARVRASLTEAERSAAALEQEGLAIRRHLEALDAISALSLRHPDLDRLARDGLSRLRETVGAPSACLRIGHGARTAVACEGMTPEEANELLDRVPEARPGEELSGFAPVPGAPQAVGAALAPIRGLRVVMVARGEPAGATAPDGRLFSGSLFRQVCLCVSHVLMRDAVRERQHIQESVLRRVIQAQEDERARVARDLHDTVAQDLAALRLELERESGHTEDAERRTTLLRLEARAREMLATVRAILLDLRLSLLESMGLVAAVRNLLDRVKAEHGVGAHLMVDGEENASIPYETMVTLFRITQEALQNALQHGAPTHVFVTLTITPQAVVLSVEDDGAGFDPAALERARPGQRGRGLGVHGMRERARLLGGTVALASTPGEGATITVTVPLAPPALPEGDSTP